MTPKKAQYTAVALAAFFLASGFLFGKEEDKAKSAEDKMSPAATAPVKVPAVGETTTVGDQQGTVVFKFENDDQMRDFASLWQQRRGIITRLAVLEAYLSEESARIEEINAAFVENYGIDMGKRFVLDSDSNILVELDSPPDQAVTAADEMEPAAAE